jgi:hypothetical protein
MLKTIRLALWLAAALTSMWPSQSFAQLQSLGAVKHFVIRVKPSDDAIDLQTRLIAHLRSSDFTVGELTPEIDRTGVAVCDLARDAKGRNHVVLECRDAAGNYVGTIRSGPAPLNWSVGAALVGVTAQINGLRGNLRPLIAYEYVFVEPMAPAAEASLDDFREALRRYAPFRVIEDPLSLEPEARPKVLYARLNSIGTTGAPPFPRFITGLVLRDESGTVIDTVSSFADVTFTFGDRKQWLKRMNNAAKDLRRDWERDRLIYGSPAADPQGE